MIKEQTYISQRYITFRCGAHVYVFSLGRTVRLVGDDCYNPCSRTHFTYWNMPKDQTYREISDISREELEDEIESYRQEEYNRGW